MPVLRFSASAPVVGKIAAASPGNNPGFDLQRLHDRLQRFAHFGGCVVARRWTLFQTGRNHTFQFDRNRGVDFAEVRRIGKLNGANCLKILGVRARKWMASACELIQNHSQSPNVGLHARLASDELLRRHVADRAAPRGVRCGDRCVFCQRRFARVKSGFLWLKASRQAKIEYLDESAFGQHHVLRFQVSMKDAQRMRSLQTICDLDADRQ